MPNLALFIFGIVFLTQTVSWIGKTVLQELAFSLYARLFLSSLRAKQRALRSQILKDKADLAKTSSQDEFAKWAKLKRKIDKSLADLEAINTKLGSAQSSFGLRFTSLLWVLTTGAQLVLVWWYRRQPVFYLPESWTPGIVRWVLSFPSAPSGMLPAFALALQTSTLPFPVRAPDTRAKADGHPKSGSVSSGAWCTVCKRVLATLEELAKDLILPSREDMRHLVQDVELIQPLAAAPTPAASVPATSEKTSGAKIEPLGIEHDKLD